MAESRQLRLEQFSVPAVAIADIGFKGAVALLADDYSFLAGLRLGQRFDLTVTVVVQDRGYKRGKNGIETRAGLEIVEFVVPAPDIMSRISTFLAADDEV